MKKYQTGGIKKPKSKPVGSKPVMEEPYGKTRPTGFKPKYNIGGKKAVSKATSKAASDVLKKIGRSTSSSVKNMSKVSFGKGRNLNEVPSPGFSPSYQDYKLNTGYGIYKSGGNLGMKSVKAGFDKNPGITRADVIVAAKGKAKGGTALKKQAAIAIAMKKAGKSPKKAKGGISMTRMANMKKGGKCKYGC